VVQASLSLIKEPPLLPGEVHSNVLKGHTILSRVPARGRRHRTLWVGQTPGPVVPVPAPTWGSPGGVASRRPASLPWGNDFCALTVPSLQSRPGTPENSKMAATRRRPEVPPLRDVFPRKCFHWLNSAHDFLGIVVGNALVREARVFLQPDQSDYWPCGSSRDAGSRGKGREDLLFVNCSEEA